MRFTFRFRPIPLLATVLLVALGLALGQWQTRRALEKEAIHARLSSRAALPPITLGADVLPAEQAEYRHLVVDGEFRADWPVYLDNRPHQGAAGFYLMMPFKIAGSDRYLMVARGWLPRNAAERTRLPSIETPSGTIRIEGVARRDAGRLLQLGRAEPPRPGAIMQNFDLDGFGAVSGLALQPFVLEQTSDSGDGLLRDWPLPSSGAEMHRGYAFQWYALALMALVFFIVTGFRNGNKQTGK